MQWFKCALEIDSILKAEEQLGEKGAYQILRIVNQAIHLEVNNLDEKKVARLGNVKIDRARRLLPYAIEYLNDIKTLYKRPKIEPESTRNLPGIYPECDQNLSGMCSESIQNLPHFDASNPHGSIRNQDKIRIDKERIEYTPLPPMGESVTKKPPAKKSIVPTDWQPDSNFNDWLAENHADTKPEELQAELNRFKDYCHANQKSYADFNAALRNWFNSPFRQKKNASGPNGGNGSRFQATAVDGRYIVPAHEREGRSGKL